MSLSPFIAREEKERGNQSRQKRTVCDQSFADSPASIAFLSVLSPAFFVSRLFLPSRRNLRGREIRVNCELNRRAEDTWTPANLLHKFMQLLESVLAVLRVDGDQIRLLHRCPLDHAQFLQEQHRVLESFLVDGLKIRQVSLIVKCGGEPLQALIKDLLHLHSRRSHRKETNSGKPVCFNVGPQEKAVEVWVTNINKRKK